MSPFHGSHYQSARRTVANGKHRKRMQMQAMLIPEKLTSSGLNMLDRTLRELRAATLSHYTFSGRDAAGLWRCSWCRVSLRSFGRKIFNALSLQPFLLDRNTFVVQWWYTDDKINNYKIVSWYSKRLTIAWCYVDAGNLERLRIGQNRLCFDMDPSVIHRYWDQMNQTGMMFTSGFLMFHVSNQRPQVDLGLFQRVDEETHELGLFPHNACGLGRQGWQRENFFDKTSCLRDTPWFMLLFEHVWMWTVLTCWLVLRMASWQFLLATTFWDLPTFGDSNIWTPPLPGNAGGQSVVLTVRRLALGNTVKAGCDEQDHGKTKWEMKTTFSTDLIMQAVLLLREVDRVKTEKEREEQSTQCRLEFVKCSR